MLRVESAARILLLVWVVLLPVAARGQSRPAGTAVSFIELRPRERYFRVDGLPGFVLGRNPVAVNPKAFEDHFAHCAAAGERFARIHFCYSPPGEKAGEVDAEVMKLFDGALDSAAKHGVAVLPVLGVWADWTDGSRQEIWHAWDKNPFNRARGGPAESPAELFEDSPCRKLWLKRLKTIVEHWALRPNIIGWEIFSELDLLTGANEERAVEFAKLAAAVVKMADPKKRPVTSSLGGVSEWPTLFASDAVEIIEVHPYPGIHEGGQLDLMILRTVRERLARYGKPVLIGECGLDAAPPRGTLDAAERADMGIRHAVWASVVSGSMAGRMLWWQDGYDQFEKADLCRHYQELSVPAAAFVRSMDFSGFAPVSCEASPGVVGAMLGGKRSMIGWFRDVRCTPPRWPVAPVEGQTVSLEASAGPWTVEYVDVTTGKVINTRTAAPIGGRLKLSLPTFQDAIAFRLKAD